MSLPNIKKNYDSEFCGSIPVNFINSIQPHGILVVLHKEDLNILQISENVQEVLHVSAEEVLNQPLATLLGEEQVSAIQQQSEQWPVRERVPVELLQVKTREGTRDFAAVIHSQDKYLLAELIQLRPNEPDISFVSVYEKIKYISLALKDAEDIKTIGDITVSEVRRLTGFDKVMLYKFDEDWNGTVIAEAKAEDMIAYLDLRFPASDVPRQSRELYFRNPYRLIPDTNFRPARLIPVLNPLTNSFTDLSSCNLRAVPKVHVEYLNNMDVQASMSVPIIVHNSLWGLISCHHKQPRYPTREVLAATELLSTLVSAQIAARERESHLQYKARVDDLKIKILEQLYAEHNLVNSISANADDILQLFRAGGVSLILNENIINTGEVPEERHIRDVVRWLKRYQQQKVFTTHALPEIYEEARSFKDITSGLMALKIANSGDNYFLIYRPEVVKTVAWGGNPNEAINFEEDGKNYHPRNSFNVWKETVSHTSYSWKEEEIEAAEKIRVAMLEKMFKL